MATVAQHLPRFLSGHGHVHDAGRSGMRNISGANGFRSGTPAPGTRKRATPNPGAPKAGGWLDRWAIGLSGLCLVHCVASSVLLALFSAAGGLLHPAFHEIGLVLAIGFGVVALGRGAMTHGAMVPSVVGAFGLGMMGGALSVPHGGAETLATLGGVSLVALGHHLNMRAGRCSRC